MKTKKLTVTYERDEDGWWVAKVPSVPGALTQGRSIDQARSRIREALSLFIDNADTVELLDDIKIDEEARERVFLVKQLQQQAVEAQRMAAVEARELVDLLREMKLSMRDVGNVLGVSPTRIQQLVEDVSAAPRAKRKTGSK
jgi:predicted RNase H-like HicB family nuclease